MSDQKPCGHERPGGIHLYYHPRCAQEERHLTPEELADLGADPCVPPEVPPPPIPMILFCPVCKARHIDEGEFATKLHHSHACQGCGLVWRPALVATVGVQYLPGFKNTETAPVETIASLPAVATSVCLLCGASKDAHTPWCRTRACDHTGCLKPAIHVSQATELGMKDYHDCADHLEQEAQRHDKIAARLRLYIQRCR